MSDLVDRLKEGGIWLEPKCVGMTSGLDENKTEALCIKAAKRIEELESAIERQAAAARTLRECTLAEVRDLSDVDRSEYFAAAALDSERAANAMLTDQIEADAKRIEELEAKLAKAVEALDFAYNHLFEINVSNYDHDDVCNLNAKSVEVILSIKATLVALDRVTE